MRVFRASISSGSDSDTLKENGLALKYAIAREAHTLDLHRTLTPARWATEHPAARERGSQLCQGLAAMLSTACRSVTKSLRFRTRMSAPPRIPATGSNVSSLIPS